MTNAWSLLYDEMTEHSKYYYEHDRNDPDRINPSVEDTITMKKDSRYKYDEDTILK